MSQVVQLLLQNKLDCLMVSQSHLIQLMPVQYIMYVDVTPTSSGTHGISDEKRKIYGMTNRTILLTGKMVTMHTFP